MPEAPAPIITPEAIDQWSRLPEDAYVQVALRRVDLDRLFLAIRESIIAQSALAAAVVSLSNGRTDEAQESMSATRKHIDNAMLNIDRLILHAMTTAKVV